MHWVRHRRGGGGRHRGGLQQHELSHVHLPPFLLHSQGPWSLRLLSHETNLRTLYKHLNKNVIEIDVRKAYTVAFCDISENRIFNDFDAFKPYGDEEILPLKLYAVKDFSHPLASQDRSLVSGNYIQDGMRFLASKKHNLIEIVDYAQSAAELYETKVSDDSQ